jgi:hypothetical protein
MRFYFFRFPSVPCPVSCALEILRVRCRPFLVCLLLSAAPLFAKAATLEEAFAGFRKCEFKDFYYAPWDPKEKVHPYLAERGLTPYKEDNGLYYFKVKDSLFGLPVSEIIIPGTWDLHAIVFDVPLAEARKTLKRQFGSVFAPSAQSAEGKAPALEAVADNPSRSSLYCNEVEGGE